MTFLTAAAFAALLPLISAQTFSVCNPMTNTTCPPNPAIEQNFECDFKNGESALNGWKVSAGALTYAPDGAQFTINNKGDAPTIQTNGYFLFGRAEVKTKAASGQGIISSIVLQSEALDEVDWEFIGGVNTEVQSNYFGKGNTTTFDRMNKHSVETPQQIAHTYIVDWTAERINFYINDPNVPVRTLNFADANGGNNYPQTPMNLRIGIWAGGDPGNSPGTIEWAGGPTDFSKAPWTQTLEYVKVTNYSPGKEYVWKDQSGSYQSIETVGGEPETGSPAKPIESPSSGVVAPAPSESPSAGSPDSPGGLGGGNGGNTIPGEFFPSSSTSCTTTVYVTVTGGETPPTGVVTSVATPSSIAVDTGVPSVPTPSTAPSAPANQPSDAASTTPAAFTGAAAAPTALSGVALAAGVLGALLI